VEFLILITKENTLLIIAKNWQITDTAIVCGYSGKTPVSDGIE